MSGEYGGLGPTVQFSLVKNSITESADWLGAIMLQHPRVPQWHKSRAAN